MKKQKRRMEFISFYDHTGLETHFAKMAQKGWLIEKMSNFGWVYRAIKPKNLRFSVTYYAKASEFDPEPTPEQQTLHDYCAHTGWQLACTWFQMQVFYNEQEDPVPLDTDPVLEVENLHTACKNFLTGHYLIAAMAIVLLGMFIWRAVEDPIGILSSGTQLMSFSCLVLMLLTSAVELVGYYSWRRRAVQAAQDGIFVDTRSTAGVQKGIVIALLALLVLWLGNLAFDDPRLFRMALIMLAYTLGTQLILTWIRDGLKKAKVSREVNQAITLISCILLPLILGAAVAFAAISSIKQGPEPNALRKKEVPLSITQLIEVDGSIYETGDFRENSFLLGYRSVTEYVPYYVEGRNDFEPYLNYTVLDVKAPFLYEICREQLWYESDDSRDESVRAGERQLYLPRDAAPWGAKEVYRLYSESDGSWYDHWFLCYEDRIIELDCVWEITPEQIETVVAALAP